MPNACSTAVLTLGKSSTKLVYIFIQLVPSIWVEIWPHDAICMCVRRVSIDIHPLILHAKGLSKVVNDTWLCYHCSFICRPRSRSTQREYQAVWNNNCLPLHAMFFTVSWIHAALVFAIWTSSTALKYAINEPLNLPISLSIVVIYSLSICAQACEVVQHLAPPQYLFKSAI